MADVVGEDEVVFRDVERLAGPEQHVGEHRVQQRMGVAAGAVQQQDGVVDMARGVAVRRAQGQVVQVEDAAGSRRP